MSGLASIPLVGGLFDDSQQQAEDQVAKNQSLWQSLQLPSSQWTNYDPTAYTSAGNLNPTMAQATTVSEDPALRSDQMSALAKMAGLADTGLSDQDKLSNFNAVNAAATQANQTRAAAEQNAISRGVGGGGLEFALGEIGSQSAENNAQQAALQAAAQSASQRALYNQAYLSGLGNERSQDLTANSANANILNQFNMANTQAANAAQQTNLANQQQINNANTAAQNSAQQYNISGAKGLAQQGFQNQVTKTQGQAGANQALGNSYNAEGMANQANRGALGQAAGTAIGAAYGDPKLGGALGKGLGSV